MKMICVHWLDASLHPEWTTTPEDADLVPLITVGFLLEQEDDRVIKVAQTNCSDIRFSAIQTIPTSNIISMKILLEGRKLRR